MADQECMAPAARDRQSAKAAAELLEQISRAAYSRGFSGGLNPAQWAALRFFAQANPSARTMTGFARAHLVTTGTAAQTISALVRKGYLLRIPVPEDARATRLDPTISGLNLLQNDPLNEMVEALCRLPRQVRRGLSEGLEALSRVVLQRAAPTERETDTRKEAIRLPAAGNGVRQIKMR